MVNNSSTDFDMKGRRSRLVEKFESAGCEALLVTSLTNIYYLSGFTGSAGLLWIEKDKALLLVDGRYGEQAVEEVENQVLKSKLKWLVRCSLKNLRLFPK